VTSPTASPAAKGGRSPTSSSALEAYEVREAGREPAASFYARLSTIYGTEIDLEAVIRDARRVDAGPDL
jgi:hypothetical protein